MLLKMFLSSMKIHFPIIFTNFPCRIIWWFDGIMNDTEDTMKGLTTNAAGNLGYKIAISSYLTS